MARNGNPVDEFAGTGDDPIVIDPAAIAAANSNGGNGHSGSAGSGDDFDPAIHAGRDKLNADGSYRRKRGRKPGGTASASAQTSTLNLAGIESVLLSVHAMLAVSISAPEIAIDKDEAKAMSDAIAEVAKHYPMQIDPKTLAWANLASCAAIVYGPRAYSIRVRRREEAEVARRQRAATDPINLR